MMNHLSWILPRHIRLLLACFAVSLLGAGCASRSLTLFVAPDGDDANPGTRARPFATVPRAMEAVRGFRSAMKQTPAAELPVDVVLRGGVYELREKIVFTPRDSGTAASPVTYRSQPGERAVLSGGRRIRGAWRPSPDKRYWQVAIPEARDGKWVFYSLYVNGQSRTRARFPNWNEKVLRADGREPGGDPRQALRYFPGDVNPNWSNPTDIDVVLLCSWTPTIHRIQEIVPERRAVRFFSSHGRPVDAWEPNFRYYLSNVFEALDTPGEWYLNRHTGMLYYYPFPGEDMGTVEVVAPVMKSRMIEFAGELAEGRFVEHLHFRDLDFRHVDGDMDRYNGMYRQGHMYLATAIGARGLRNASFERCEMAQLGEYALEFADGCQNVTVRQCHIWDIGAGAMQLGVTDLGTLRRSLFAEHPGDIMLEAEQATVTAPMVVQEDKTASGGRCVALPPDSGAAGSVLFDVEIPKADRYVLYCRVVAPSGSDDSFTVQINEGVMHTYDTGVGRQWFSSPVVSRELKGARIVVDLPAGKSRIVFLGREDGLRFDRLILRRESEAGAGGGTNERVVHNLVIDNNCIHRLGTIWHGCYGIVNRFASLTRITHNEIYDTHWDAIGLDARWNWQGETYSHGNVVAYNHLHHLGLRYHTDAAGVYQFGPLDTHIHHNVIHDNVAYPYICGFAGIYLDQQSRNALVENNLVYNVEWYAYFQHKGMDNTFRNNIGAFARNGLIRRGGLNEKWKANHMEAYRNIYIADNEIALHHGWQPGDKPPVLRNNMYHTLAKDSDLTFAGKSFADWQAEGQDEDSVIGDPGCRNPAAFDFSLKRNASAIKAIGFVPFDKEIRKAGLYGDAAWRAMPAKHPPRAPAPAWTAEDFAKLVAFDMDFNLLADGAKPGRFRISTDQDAGFEVTSEISGVKGDKCLKCTDKKGLRKPFYPYMHIVPRKLDKGEVVFSFAARQPAKMPAHFYVEFRGEGQTSNIGPSLDFGRDGAVLANGNPVCSLKPDAWTRFEIRFHLGEKRTGSYLLKIRGRGETQVHFLPFGNEIFEEVRWLGISAADDADGAFYLDDLKLEIKD